MTALQLKVNKFLYELQRSGIVNMFGAAPYVEQVFDVTPRQAKVLVVAWMKGWNKAEWEAAESL